MTRHTYARDDYVAALGTAITALSWSTAVVGREIADGGGHDAIGSYPMAIIRGDVSEGLEELRAHGLVSVVVVPDPLAHHIDAFREHFDRVTAFKTHLLIDGPFEPSAHHRERIRRGHRRCRIEQGKLARWLPDWCTLYAGLVESRGVTGMAAFSKGYFDVLAKYDDITAFAAFVGEDMAGMTLWFANDGIVYNHLTACNEAGYRNGAAFALYDAAITHFGDQGVINLGGGPGAFGAEDSGLFQFKQGFANSKTAAHVCGAVLDREAYDRLAADKPKAFFPAYRG